MLTKLQGRKLGTSRTYHNDITLRIIPYIVRHDHSDPAVPDSLLASLRRSTSTGASHS